MSVLKDCPEDTISHQKGEGIRPWRVSLGGILAQEEHPKLQNCCSEETNSKCGPQRDSIYNLRLKSDLWSHMVSGLEASLNWGASFAKVPVCQPGGLVFPVHKTEERIPATTVNPVFEPKRVFTHCCSLHFRPSVNWKTWREIQSLG